MDICYIKDKLKYKTSDAYGTNKKSSVMVLFVERDNDIHIILNQRAFHLNSQPGDICFPGGKQDKNELPIETAYREVFEELNIKRENIELIGKCDTIFTYGRGVIIPFMGVLKNVDVENINFSTSEVANVFTVPLSFFIENSPKSYKISYEPILSDDFPTDLIVNGKGYKFLDLKSYIYFYNYNNIIIWGITAKIIKNIIDLIK